MSMSTPLLESDSCCARVARVDGREGECACHTIDAYLEIGRYGRHGRWPGPPTLLPLLLLGVSAYGISSLLVLQPTFLDDQMRAEWFAGEDQAEEGRLRLAGVSSGFFLLWGVGTPACPVLAD